MAKINLFVSGNNRRLTGNVGRCTVYSYRYCPHCMRSRVYVTVRCPSVCLFVRLSVAILYTCMWDGNQDMIYMCMCRVTSCLFYSAARLSLSVCLSQRGSTTANPLLQVCCCEPGAQMISTDCCPDVGRAALSDAYTYERRT